MITPTTFFHHVQHAEEYRQQPVVGVFLRLPCLIAMFLSLFFWGRKPILNSFIIKRRFKNGEKLAKII
jgi:hypothetical protein